MPVPDKLSFQDVSQPNAVSVVPSVTSDPNIVLTRAGNPSLSSPAGTEGQINTAAILDGAKIEALPVGKTPTTYGAVPVVSHTLLSESAALGSDENTASNHE